MRALAVTLLLFLASLVSVACSSEDRPADTWVGIPDAPPPFDVAVEVDLATGFECGNGTIEGDERCDDGPDNGAYGRCGTDCRSLAPRCGDGSVQVGLEVCDDGEDNGDYGKCDVICQGPSYRCGNGFIEPDHEVCDDGDEKNGTYGWCARDCQGRAPGCGDGVVTPPFESCDDGDNNGQPGYCASDCNPTPGCGDGEVVAPEVCDDGSANGDYGRCSRDCAGRAAFCGDGIVQGKHEVCDDGAANGDYGNCLVDCSGLGPRCGDGVMQAPEVCDDGPANGQDGRCAHDCLAFTPTWTATPELGALDGTTCRDEDLLAKYMRYRLRLRGDRTAQYPGFVVIGLGEGKSIPASRRDPDTDCAGYWGFGTCPRPDLADAKGLYSWGDGTIWLGEYIAYLALEYAMFERLGISTTETLSDLRYAMVAFDRVDEKAESFYPGVAPRRDGFYVRDDVPLDFHRAGNGYRFPRADGHAGYECVSGDLLCDPPHIEDGSFTSQDQSLTLIMGLALVARLVPPEVQVDGLSLREDAREKVHRIVWFLKSHGWKVKDPAGGQPPDAWGGNAIGFSNAFAKCANAVCGDTFGVDDYRDFASRTIGEAAFVGIEAIWEATHAYNRTHALRLAAVNGDWSMAKLASRSLGDGKDYYALVAAILQDGRLPAPFSEWRVEALLRSASCEGPCRENQTCNQTPGWMGESRTMNAGDRFGSRHWRGEFNGLDYLATFAALTVYRGGYRVPVGRAAECPGARTLMTIAETGAQHGDGGAELYDPNASCNRADLGLELCRRPFARWLEDAYRGKVAIFAGGRWQCTPGGPCRISRVSAKNTSGDDLILGSASNDELSGGDGNDCLVGFGGDDKLEGNQGYDELWGLGGQDRLYGESSGLVLDGEADVLFGGDGDDTLEGNPGKDELYGEAGHDTLDGGNGDDFLWAGIGNDVLRGGLGDDTMHGGDGDDSLIGDGGDDQLWGGPGRDKLDGEEGDDYCHGGVGPDFVRGGNGKDVLISGDEWALNQLDKDRLCGNGGDDTLWGGWDGDQCLGGGWFLGGTDTINGCDDETATTGECDNGAFADW